MALRSGSRWSVWLCVGCLQLTRGLNHVLGRYAIPVGRHSLHGGIALHGESSNLDVALFAARWRNATVASGAVDRWAGTVVRRILGARWSDGGDVSLPEYLAACEPSEEEKRHRFDEVLRFYEEEADNAANV